VFIKQILGAVKSVHALFGAIGSLQLENVYFNDQGQLKVDISRAQRVKFTDRVKF
jgi:hypothetical protein